MGRREPSTHDNDSDLLSQVTPLEAIVAKVVSQRQVQAKPRYESPNRVLGKSCVTTFQLSRHRLFAFLDPMGIR